MTSLDTPAAVGVPPPQEQPPAVTITSTPTFDARRAMATMVVRWVVILAATGIAFHSTLAAVAREMATGNLMVYQPIAICGAIMVSMGVLARDHAQLPIHDRQSDGIVGVILLALAWVVQYKLVARFSDVYLTLHLDLLALWMFLLGSCVLLFGTRPTLRHRGSWLILLATFPFPIRLLTLLLGGTAASASTVIIGIAVASAALAAGRNASRVAIGTVTAGGAGAMALVVMRMLAPDTSPALVIAGPAFVAGLTSGVALYIDDVRRFGVTNNLVRMPARRVVASGSWRVVLTLLVATAAIAVVTVPSGNIRPPRPVIAGLQTTGPPVVPDLWDQTALTRYDFAGRLYGKGGSMTRQRLVARFSDPAWDLEGRRRVIVADTITTRRPILLSVYPVYMVYDLSGVRMSAAVPVPLGDGVTGQLGTLVDDKRYLTYTRLTWRWSDGPVAQSIQLLAVDDHRDGAPFPTPRLTPFSTAGDFLAILLRGDAIVRDERPEFKDREMLTAAARSMVRQQVATAASRQAADR
ncbi:hypothetical protein GCM10009773_12200 [Williamsia serinedens]